MKTSELHATTKLHTWWKPKASNLLAVLYLVMLVTGLPVEKAVWLFIPSVITILGIGSFGHLINDWYDIDADQKVGKNNRLAVFSVWQRRGLVAGALAVALLPWLILPFNYFSILLLALEFTFLLAYAMPPVRLKERQLWPLFADGAYAYAIPAVLAAHTFFLAGLQESDPVFLGLLFLWQLALGVRHFMNHLALDRINDITTHTPTLATLKGNRFIHRLIRKHILPLELIAFMTFMINISQYEFVLAIFVLCIWILIPFLYLLLANARLYPFPAYQFSKTTLDWFYQDSLPLIPLLWLTIKDGPYIFLIILHVILFHPGFLYNKKQPPHFFLVRYLLYWPAYYTFQYAIYYYKRILLGYEDYKARGKSYEEYLASHPPSTERAGHEKRANIAIVNINKAKYTETFIQALTTRLNYNVYYLYGGNLPVYDHKDRHFLSVWRGWRAWAGFLEAFLHLGKDYFLKQNIAGYLQSRKIRLVLAQFGPVGVQMFSITRDLGIPLIVYFHGYDVFHKEIFRLYAESYKLLFREAEKIIGVSEIMLQRLHQLGAPQEKLIHLPAFANLELFPYADHSHLPPRFLAVGRFAETKSPHLTLLAFHKVAQRIPEATLTLIGKGGGGELFEACLILARALGIEKKVEFKGALAHEEIAREMQAARVFVQHSLKTPEYEDMEGKPVAIMEAMACGLPVVATQHSGIVELIAPEITGLLVDEYDIEAMAAAMLRLAQDDKLVKYMGQNASKSIHHHPLISNHIKLLDKIIRDCIT